MMKIMMLMTTLATIMMTMAMRIMKTMANYDYANSDDKR